MKNGSNSPFQRLPSVGKFLDSSIGKALAAEFGSGAVKLELRSYLDQLRANINTRSEQEIPAEAVFAQVLHQRLLRFCKPLGRRAINATGIILHTGLGRAPLCKSALEAANISGYSIVQVDIDSGGRSQRDERIERMLVQLTGCEAATVVNNNAAATMIALNWLATRGHREKREVIISRGQLIEIGGSFRMPDVMEQSGAILREVGTTNRTHLRDYQRVINETTAGIVHVHPSNYRIGGFTGTPSVAELSELAQKHGLPLIADLGSGALVSLTSYGLHNVLTVAEAVDSGATLTCFSGDKLICGPQAGILVGESEAIAAVRKNPYARMFRVDKLTLAALEATLLEYLNGTYRENIPLYQILGRSLEELEQQGRQFISALAAVSGIVAEVVDDRSYTGGGALPEESLPSKVVKISTTTSLKVAAISEWLRLALPSVFCRVKDDALHFDMRTVFAEEMPELITQVVQGLKEAQT